jgi:hypothetical protein
MAEHQSDKTRARRYDLVRELKLTDRFSRSHTATGVLRRRFRIGANGEPEIVPLEEATAKAKSPPNPKRLESLKLANEVRQKRASVGRGARR